jgi:anti-sigma regulatory factor (Ser/Thr protein kinase)
MSTAAIDATRAVPGFRHDALLYAGAEQFVQRTATFVRDALDHDEPILVAVIEPRRSLLREELGPDAKHVEFLDMWDVGRNPARIIPAWQRWVERHQSAGRGFRGIGEPIWATRSPHELIECQIHEQLLNTAFDAGPGWWLLCPYDTESLPAPVIARAHATHPGVVFDQGRHSPSDHYPHRDMTFAAMFGLPLSEPDPRHMLFESEFALSDIPAMRDAVESHAGTLGVLSQRTADLVLVASELASNSVRHGGGGGVLRLWREQTDLVCEVRDRGVVEDPLIGRRRPVPHMPGGAGLWLANQLCDLVQIRSTGQSGTVVRVRIPMR